MLSLFEYVSKKPLGLTLMEYDPHAQAFVLGYNKIQICDCTGDRLHQLEKNHYLTVILQTIISKFSELRLNENNSTKNVLHTDFK